MWDRDLAVILLVRRFNLSVLVDQFLQIGDINGLFIC